MCAATPFEEPTADLAAMGGPVARERVRCSVITVGDGLTLEQDTCGRDVDARLLAAGYRVVERTVVPQNPALLAIVTRHWITADVEVIVVAADTWSTRATATLDVLHRFVDRELPAFGHLFASLAFSEVGIPAFVYRAMAGLANGKLLFLLPSMDWAVRIAMDKLIAPRLDDLLIEVGVLPGRPS